MTTFEVLTLIGGSSAILGIVILIFQHGKYFQKIENHDQKFDSIDKKLDSIHVELKEIKSELRQIDSRVSRIEGHLIGMHHWEPKVLEKKEE